MPFDLGDTVRLTAECRDADGTLTTADTATLTVTLPDGSTVSPSVPVPESAGQYVYDYVTDTPGRHSVRWVFAGPATAYTDMIDVRPADPGLILSLANAKAQLNITSNRSDDEIRGWLESVTDLVAQFTGITVRRSFTDLITLPPSGARAFVLKHSPVISLTSVDGDTGAVASLDVDSATGVVRPVSGGLVSGSFRVTYSAGRAEIPAPIRGAALIILQHLWRTQRNASRGPVPGGGSDFSVSEPIPGLGYAIPNRALQLMEPYRLPPGVA